MATFPAIIPSGRTWLPGEYASTSHRAYSGAEVRVRHSNMEVGATVRLIFRAISTSEMLAIKAHFSGQKGGFLSFQLPVQIFSGMDSPADFAPVGNAWKYASRVAVQDIPIPGDTPSNRHDVTIELQSVPADVPLPAPVPGSVIDVTLTVEGGAVGASLPPPPPVEIFLYVDSTWGVPVAEAIIELGFDFEAGSAS